MVSSQPRIDLTRVISSEHAHRGFSTRNVEINLSTFNACKKEHYNYDHCFHSMEKTKSAAYPEPVLWIRIQHFKEIRIRIQIQGFDDQKFEK
jgi:hypothetical protein